MRCWRSAVAVALRGAARRHVRRDPQRQHAVVLKEATECVEARGWNRAAWACRLRPSWAGIDPAHFPRGGGPQMLASLPHVGPPGARQGSSMPEEAKPGHLEMLPEAVDIFHQCWRRLESKFGQDIVTPREIVWLNGAPGAGKGVNTPFILKSRGLGRAVSMSDILTASPEVAAIINRGGLVPDELVVDALLNEIFDPQRDDGIGLIVDGFPRTECQADILKLLFENLQLKHKEHEGSPDSHMHPNPSFKVVVLYVNEEESIKRQRLRGLKSSVKIERAKDAGTDNADPIRASDTDERICFERYKTFKKHYHALFRLKSLFPFHLIDAMGSLEDTRRQISRELRYQSSTDLDEETYKLIRHLPMAQELNRLVRQQLTARLDRYALHSPTDFQQVIKIIDTAVVPILRRCGMAGEAVFLTQEDIFLQCPRAADMLIDVLSDRGFHVSYNPVTKAVPHRVDLQTGEITCAKTTSHRFKITFRVSSVRDGVESPDAAGGSPASQQPDISTSIVPSGFDHQMKLKYSQPRDEITRKTLSLDEMVGVGDGGKVGDADRSIGAQKIHFTAVGTAKSRA